MVTQVLESNIAEYGEGTSLVRIPYLYWDYGFFEQVASGIRTGPEVQRDALQGLVRPEIASMAGGLVSRSGIHDWRTSLDKVAYSEGLQCHIPGILCHPYALTTQASLVGGSVDFSGYRTTNKRVYLFNNNQGGAKLRVLGGVGPYIFRSVGDSDSSLEVASTRTNNVVHGGEFILNSTKYAAFSFDNQTDDILGTTDITAALPGGPTWVGLVTYPAAADQIKFVSLDAGGLAHMLYYGRFNGVDGAFYSKHADTTVPLTTLTRVVDTGSAAARGSLATTTTAAKSPTITTVDLSGGTAAWSNPERIVASDGNDATATVAASAITDFLIGGGFFDGDDIPSDAYLEGLSLAIEASESSTAQNLFFYSVEIMLNNTSLGIDRAPANSSELAATDTVYTFGSSTDSWGRSNLRGSDAPGLSVRVRFNADAGGAGAASNLTVDHMTLTITYRLPGSPIDIPVGGDLFGKSPTNRQRVGAVIPESDELATVNVPRHLEFWDITYDPGTDRPTMARVYPNTGMKHVEQAAWGLGGCAVIGDNSSGLATSLKLVRSDGEVMDLRLITSYNGAAWGCSSINPQGRVILCDMVKTDGTEAQTMGWFDGKFYPSFLLQSKSNAIATIPLAMAITDVGSELRRIYPRFFPVSTTALAVSRQFYPRDWFADPLITNTTENKYEGALFIRSPELNLGGPIEANKTLNTIQYQGRQISAAGGAYGTVKVEIDTGGDTAVTSAEVNTGSTNWNTGSGAPVAFQTYNVPSSGVAFRTAIIKTTIDNTGDATKTPNALPLVFTITSSWEDMDAINVYIDPKRLDTVDKAINWLTTLKTLKSTKNVQRLRIETLDMPATLQTPKFRMMSSPTGRPALIMLGKDGNPQQAYLTFLRKPGKVTA